MDPYEQLLRDGLRDAVRRKPDLGTVNLSEITSGHGGGPDTEGAVLRPAPRSRRRRRLGWAVAGMAAAAVTAVFLAIPPGTTRPIEAVPAGTPTPAEAPPSAQPEQRWASAALAPDDMPLAPYFAALRRVEEYKASRVSSAEVQRWTEDREAFLTQCMAEQGFEYYPPVDARPGGDVADEFAAGKALRYRDKLPMPALDADRGVVAVVGYGRASTPEEQLDHLLNRGGDARNTEYLASLSAAERDQWEIAMNGQTNDDTRVNPTTDGCYWEAERTYPDPAFADGRASLDLPGIVVDLLAFSGDDDPIEADPRLVALNQQWRACMARTGLPTEQFRVGAAGPGRMDGPDAALALAVATGRDGTVADYPTPDDAPVDQRSLVGSEPEIRVALADYDCRQATSYETTVIAIQRDLEEQFVEAHQEELDDLLAYIDTAVP